MSWFSVLEMSTDGRPVKLNHVEIESLPSIQGAPHSFLHNDGFGNWSWEEVDWSFITNTVAGSGHAIQDEGTPLTQRANLNFVGAGVVATDDPGNNATLVSISGGGGGSIGGSGTNGRLVQWTGATTVGNATNTDTDVSSAVSLKHAQSHSVTSATDHTSSATSGQMLKADANGLPIDASNTDAQVASAVSLKHTQGTDTALGALATKNPPIDADKAIYRDSTSGDSLVTSTWTQVKAFLKTYFDSIYQAVLTNPVTGTGTSGKIVKFTGSHAIGDATNTDTDVADAVTKKHAQSHDHSATGDGQNLSPNQVVVNQDFYFKNAISDTITTDQNNYNPTGLATAGVIEITNGAGGDLNINGIVGGANGRILVLVNAVTSGDNIILNRNWGSTTAANRFYMTDSTITLLPLDAVILRYREEGVNKWYVIGKTTKFLPPLHDIITSHSYSGGAALDVFGLSAASTIAKLTPSSNPGAGSSLLKSDPSGKLTLIKAALTGLPTSTAGLSAGDIWCDTTGGLNILKVV